MSISPRVVFDCNTLLQALASPEGPAGRCMQLALKGGVQLLISPAVIEELRDVTSRPKVVVKLHLVQERVEEFFEAIAVAATLLEGIPESFHYDRDPDDVHYVNLALAGDAQLIVSRDRDLLELMRSTTAEAADFRSRFPTLRIVDPVSFLAEMARRIE